MTERAGGSLVHLPIGNAEKHGFGWFSGDPAVQDGSSIFVSKVPPPPPESGIEIGVTIKDVFAIVTSAATIIYLASQIKK